MDEKKKSLLKERIEEEGKGGKVTGQAWVLVDVWEKRCTKGERFVCFPVRKGFSARSSRPDRTGQTGGRRRRVVLLGRH